MGSLWAVVVAFVLFWFVARAFKGPRRRGIITSLGAGVAAVVLGGFALCLLVIGGACSAKNACEEAGGDVWMLPFMLAPMAICAFFYLAAYRTNGGSEVDGAKLNSHLEKITSEHLAQLDRADHYRGGGR